MWGRHIHHIPHIPHLVVHPASKSNMQHTQPDMPFTPEEEALHQTIGAAAKALNMPAWLIGGFVRDKILSRPCKDVDVVCIGDGIALAHEMAKRVKPRPAVAFFKNFGTAQIKTQGFEVEFVGARK